VLIVGAGESGQTLALRLKHRMSDNHDVNMRTAAYMVAVSRVAEATTLRGLYP